MNRKPTFVGFFSFRIIPIILLVRLEIFKILLEKCWIFLILHECFIADLIGLVKIYESMLHKYLSILSPRLHDRIEVTYITIHDDIATRICIYKYLSCNNMSCLLLIWKYDLTYDTRQYQSELDTYLRLHPRRECIDQTIKSLDHIIGMESGYDEVSCFSKGKDSRNRLLITHFSHDEHIRIFTHSITHSLIERRYMFPYLFLVD